MIQKIIKIFFLISLLYLFLGCDNTKIKYIENINFKDANLKKSIKEYLLKNKYYNITDVKKLELTKSKIVFLDGIESFKDLEYLDLKANRIEDITPIKRLLRLEKLILSLNYFTDISPLENIESLKYLEIQALLKVKNFDSISNIKSLEYLNLLGNSLKDSDLKNIKSDSLKHLDLSFNELTNLDTIKNFPHLEVLVLSSNKINDISGIKYLKKLTKINLTGNNIKNIYPLVANKNIYNSTIYIHVNPLDEKSIKEYIPILEKRGNFVGY